VLPSSMGIYILYFKRISGTGKLEAEFFKCC
jgi:hypothetical protein